MIFRGTIAALRSSRAALEIRDSHHAMTPILRTTLLYSLVPVVFTIIGAAAGAFWPVMARFRGYVLHLAAGVVFAVVAVELLPEIQHRAGAGGAMEVVLSFGLAALLYLVTEELLREAHEERETTLATATFFAGFLAFLVIGMVLD